MQELMFRNNFIACLFVLLTASGCATIAHGTSQTVALSSEPPGAQVSLDGAPIGVTPTEVRLFRRKGGMVLRFEKEGFAAQDVAVERKGSRWLIGDAAFAGAQFANQGLDSTAQMAGAAGIVLGVTMGVDLLTGGAFTFPSEIRATLKPAQ